MPASPRMITLAEVEQHATYDDLWLVIDGKVYDVTPFLEYFQPDLAVEDAQLCRGTDASELFFAALVPEIAAGDSQRATLFTRPPSRWRSRRRTGTKRMTTRQRGMLEKVRWDIRW